MDPKFGIFWIFLAAFLLDPVVGLLDNSDAAEEVVANSQGAESKEEHEVLQADDVPDANEWESLNTETTDVQDKDGLTADEEDPIVLEADVAKVPDYQEADDMEYGGVFQNRTVFVNSEPMDLPTIEPDAEETVLSDPIPSNLKYAVEWIETRDENTVDIDDIHSRPLLHVTETWPWILTMVALAMMFVLFLIGSVLMYKLLTKRYKNRQILINEEDMIDPNDMKHFSL